MITQAASDSIVSRNPATNEVIGEVDVSDESQVHAAIERARVAQSEWASFSLKLRIAAIRKVKNVMIERRDEIARHLSSETGKTRLEALTGEVFPTVDCADYYVRKARTILETRRVPHRLLKTTRSYREMVPYGVVGIITPWNYPFFLTMGPSLSALVAGNAVINKPSEHTPLTGDLVVEIFRQAGIPKDLFQVVHGYGEVGAALISGEVDKISFTGSVSTGRKVASMAGERLIPVTLELGGKDPMIVLEDAPLDRAASCAVWGAFCNSGQICASIERIYVHESVADAFLEKVVTKTRELRQGVDSDFSVDVGSMQNEQQLKIVAGQVKDAREKGASIEVGGEVVEGKEGLFFAPTILTGVTDSMVVAREETFGPVVPIFRVTSAEEAVRLARDTEFGLTASIWSEDDRKARRLARQLDFGAVYINDMLAPSSASEIGWGGFKNSGFGKSRGPEGLLDMVRTKHVSVDRLRMEQMPYWYPYTETKYQRFSSLIKDVFADSPLKRIWGILKSVPLFLKGA